MKELQQQLCYQHTDHVHVLLYSLTKEVFILKAIFFTVPTSFSRESLIKQCKTVLQGKVHFLKLKYTGAENPRKTLPISFAAITLFRNVYNIYGHLAHNTLHSLCDSLNNQNNVNATVATITSLEDKVNKTEKSRPSQISI